MEVGWICLGIGDLGTRGLDEFGHGWIEKGGNRVYVEPSKMRKLNPRVQVKKQSAGSRNKRQTHVVGASSELQVFGVQFVSSILIPWNPL